MIEMINDSFQNWKRYISRKAQLIISDPPYNLGNSMWASNPMWYEGGDMKNGESSLAGKAAFDTDFNFRPAEWMHFCSRLLVKEPKERGKSPCMVIFCGFEQQMQYIELGRRYGFNHYINLVFRKNYSPQVLKANMKIVGNCEYGLILYRDKLPKFNNNGQMVFNCIDWPRDTMTPKVHPCLPAGEKVFINNQWMNIEDVISGDASSYGTVIGTSSHEAERIIEIQTDDGIAKATWNHPFLILRGTEVAWCEAEQITTSDYILWRTDVRKYINPHRKDTFDSMSTTDLSSNMSLYGNSISGKYPMDTKSTIRTETERTIILKISNLSLPLNTNGYTRVADLKTENGSNLVQYVENISHVHPITGISPEELSTEESARSATLPNPLLYAKFSLRKVGSVKTIHETTKVYNLTIEGIPAFDTVIGVSHNTQKPVPLLEMLIELFTDSGDLIIDPTAGSGTSLLAAANCGREAVGFEIKKEFCRGFEEKLRPCIQPKLFI